MTIFEILIAMTKLGISLSPTIELEIVIMRNYLQVQTFNCVTPDKVTDSN
jgi:hypothetical protein